MPDYRAIVEHVRYWRGQIHTWSTSYSFTGSPTHTIDSAACQTLLTADRQLLQSNTSVSAGDAYRCSIYLASGGTPLATYTAFDPTAYANWTNPPAANGWQSAGTVDPVAEAALLVEWPAGTSSSGKPVTFKKFFHQVLRSNAAPGSPDINSSLVTSLTTAATALGLCLNSGYGLIMGNSHRLAGTPRVRQFYVTHQMPRGRRKKVTCAASAARFGETVLRLAEQEAYSNADA